MVQMPHTNIPSMHKTGLLFKFANYWATHKICKIYPTMKSNFIILVSHYNIVLLVVLWILYLRAHFTTQLQILPRIPLKFCTVVQVVGQVEALEGVVELGHYIKLENKPQAPSKQYLKRAKHIRLYRSGYKYRLTNPRCLQHICLLVWKFGSVSKILCMHTIYTFSLCNINYIALSPLIWQYNFCIWHR